MKKIGLRLTVSLIVVSLVTFGISLQANSQDQSIIKYPEKALTLMVGFNPGGPSDLSCRIIAPFLEKELGQPVVIVNKPGSAGELSYSLLASSKPDGYALCTIGFPNIIAQLLHHKTNFKKEDFAWLGSTSYDENVIVVKAGGKYKTLDDLIKAAKSKPGEITMGDAGPLGDDQLAAMVFAKAAGIQFNYISFKGTGPSLVALLGGHVEAVACNVGDIVEQFRSKKMIVLASTGDKPSPYLPGVPTLAGLGYKVYTATYRVLAVSAKTPPQIITKLRTSLKKAAENPEAIQKAKEVGLPIVWIDHQQVNKAWEEMNDKLLQMNLDKIKLGN